MDDHELAALAVELEEHDVIWSFQITPAQAADLATGYVPAMVRAQALYALESEDNDRRRANRVAKLLRPVRKRRR